MFQNYLPCFYSHIPDRRESPPSEPLVVPVSNGLTHLSTTPAHRPNSQPHPIHPSHLSLLPRHLPLADPILVPSETGTDQPLTIEAALSTQLLPQYHLACQRLLERGITPPPPIHQDDRPYVILTRLLTAHRNAYQDAPHEPMLDLSGLDFSGMRLEHLDFYRCNLTGAVFKNTNNTGLLGRGLYHVGFTDAILDRVDFTNATLDHVSLKNASLTDAVLERASLTHCDVTNGSLTRANMRHANLSHVSLKDAILTDAVLEGVCATHCHVTNGSFDRANVSGARFYRCNFNGVMMHDSRLNRAAFNCCRWRQVQCHRADLRGTVLHKTSLEDAITLGGASVEGMVINDVNPLSTLLHAMTPDGMPPIGVPIFDISCFKYDDHAIHFPHIVDIPLVTQWDRSLLDVDYLFPFDLRDPTLYFPQRSDVSDQAIQAINLDHQVIGMALHRRLMAMKPAHPSLQTVKVAVTIDELCDPDSQSLIRQWLAGQPPSHHHLLLTSSDHTIHLAIIPSDLLDHIDVESRLRVILDDCQELTSLLLLYPKLPPSVQTRIQTMTGLGPLWQLIQAGYDMPPAPSDAESACPVMGIADSPFATPTDAGTFGYPAHKVHEIAYLMSHDQFERFRRDPNQMAQRIATGPFKLALPETLVMHLIKGWHGKPLDQVNRLHGQLMDSIASLPDHPSHGVLVPLLETLVVTPTATPASDPH